MSCSLTLSMTPRQVCGGVSAIPLTMELVDTLRIKAVGGRRNWHRHDRVLAYLDAEIIPAIREFYNSGGPGLSALMDDDELHAYDMECLSRLMIWLSQNETDTACKVVAQCA